MVMIAYRAGNDSPIIVRTIPLRWVDTMEENAMRKRPWLSTIVLAGTMAAVPALAQQPAEQQVMDLANADRAQQGLPPLKWDPALAQAAAQHAQLMAQQPASCPINIPVSRTWSPVLAQQARISVRLRRTSPWRRVPRRWTRSGCTRLLIARISSIRA